MCMDTTVYVNGTVQFTFFLGHENEYYHCHKLWFAYCNTCTFIFSSLKLKNGLKKHVRNIDEIKYGFVKLKLTLKQQQGKTLVVSFKKLPIGWQRGTEQW